MYRTDHAHQWQRTEYAPMSSAYARTLYDEAALLMTGDTRPAPLPEPRREDFRNTTPFFVHESRPGDLDTHQMPLELLDAQLMRRPEPGTIITDAQAEIMAAQAAGAHMGGGMQDVSRPVPLEHDRSTQYLSSLWANRVMLALAIGLAGYYLGKVFA